MEKTLTTRIPFAFARSALFRPAERIGKVLGNVVVPAADDYRIELNYSGPELTPFHALAWQALVALAFHENKGTGDALEVRLIDVLRAMGRTSIQTHAKRWLRGLLDDLTLARVAVNTRRQAFHGALLDGILDLGNGKVSVFFAEGMADLLADEVVMMPMASKQGLGAYPLALWLHDYIATHQKVYEVPTKTLHRLAGSCLELGTFRLRLRKALDRLRASGGLLERYTLDATGLTLHKGKTRVVLLPAAAQAASHWQRRVAKSAAQARQQRARVPL